MKWCISLFFITTLWISCQSQNGPRDKVVGGPCEGCEAIHEHDGRPLSPTDTIYGFEQFKPQIKLTGQIFLPDGKTPAPDVILYIYHTDIEGIYKTIGNEKGWARMHGVHRGWIKTDADGRYTFFTFRPGAYPGGQEPEHIHFTIKEPDKNEYWIDAVEFDDDPLLTASERKGRENRCGSGITIPFVKDGMLTIERNIYLGLNIPNYD